MEIDPGTPFQLSRAALERPGHGVEDVDGANGGAQELTRSVVSATERCMSALVASPGDIRRVDLWADGEVLVMHAYSKDRNHPCPGVCYRGRESALVAISQLLGSPDETSTESGPHCPTSFDSLQELLEHVIEQPTAEGQSMRMCALNTSPSDPESELLIVAGPQPLRWTVAHQQQPFSLAETSLAQMWGRVIEMVDLAFGRTDSDERVGAGG